MRQERNHKAADAGRHQSIIERLSVSPQIGALSYVGLKTVAATRLLAVCSRAGRDPLLELTQRFACVTTAKAFIAFADSAGAFWPDNIQVMRPCCRIVSPDELTLAQMIDCAGVADRDNFGHLLSGLVRRERHDMLFDRATELVAMMH